MTTMTVFENGISREQVRGDAVRYNGRFYVPTSAQTLFVHDWHEFKAVGGQVHFEEDQTEIRLTLPEPYKFGIRFQE